MVRNAANQAEPPEFCFPFMPADKGAHEHEDGNLDSKEKWASGRKKQTRNGPEGTHVATGSKHIKGAKERLFIRTQTQYFFPNK